VTRDDVARAAGVSTAVVSYVLNNGPRGVSAESRRRVLAAIEELGYRRDGVARFLRLGRTQSLGLVLPDPALPYFGEFTKHTMAAAGSAARQMLLGYSDWDPERERAVIAELVERRVEGIVLLSADPSQSFDDLHASPVPIVVVDRPEVARQGAHAAVAHFVEHGHSDLGVLAGPAHLEASRRRTVAWSEAVREAGLVERAEWVVHDEVSRRGGYVAALRLLDLDAPPTAVFIESDAQAHGFLRAVYERGLRVPQDCALITAEGTEQALFSVPGMTSTEQPIGEIARAALALVLDGSGVGVRWMSDEQFTLVRRGSCGCPEPDVGLGARPARAGTQPRIRRGATSRRASPASSRTGEA
jgi:LacI family transcriptional regulator, galactose operon repressor